MLQCLSVARNRRLEQGFEAIQDTRLGSLACQGNGPAARVDVAHARDEPEVPIREETDGPPRASQQEDRRQQDDFPPGAVVDHEQKGVVAGMHAIPELDLGNAPERQNASHARQQPVAATW
jgi:hypothetical protein